MQTITLVLVGVALVAFAVLSLINSRFGSPWKDKALEPPGPALVRGTVYKLLLA
jgi:hypothetical protein